MKKTTTAIVLTLVALAVFMTAIPAEAQRLRPSRPGASDTALKANYLQMSQSLLKMSAGVDFQSLYTTYVVNDPTSPTNGNFLFMAIAQGNAWTIVYELGGRNPSAVDKAAEQYETAINLHPYWQHNWLSGGVANYLATGFWRLLHQDDLTAMQEARLTADWQQIRELLASEADAGLQSIWVPEFGTSPLPFGPLDSSATGKSRAADNGWWASCMSAAANYYPEHPHAEAWAAKAKELAYDSVSRPSDPAYPGGVKVTTIADGTNGVNDHGFNPNGMYTAAALEFLHDQGPLPYVQTGHAVPEEFTHNWDWLHAKYVTNVGWSNGWPLWIAPCDNGNPTDMPLVDGTEYGYAALKAQSGYIFRTAELVSPLGDGNLWDFLQAFKVMVRWHGAYQTHFPFPSPQAQPAVKVASVSNE